VWLSEIMLQQTQVSTVKAYYAKFLERCPQVADLAQASHDEVMALWAGLGYYSRARNLHACAKAVMNVHGGEFPQTAELLQTLPGIGRSTAAAIAAFCFSERVAILDGNVKRVLSRVQAFKGDLASAASEKQLWTLAQSQLPTRDLSQTIPRYTQAIMDLGATVCTPKQPACHACPMQRICQAYAQGRVQDFPIKTKKIKRSSESWWLLLASDSRGRILLEQRPTPGIWAGLYCLPMFASEQALRQTLTARQQMQLHTLPAFKHVLTHKDLHLHVLSLSLTTSRLPSMAGQWVAQPLSLGLPAPIKKILASELL
jgi:A/G-specific adenine glycosylase